MDPLSGGESHCIEEVWLKTEPTDVESTAYFYTESEDGINVVKAEPSPTTVTSNINGEWKAVSVKSEFTFGEYECIPSSESIASQSRTVLNSYKSLNSRKRCRSDDKSFICDECGMKFMRKSYMQPHKVIYTGIAPFSCTECFRKFASKCLLEQHKKVHTVESAITSESILVGNNCQIDLVDFEGTATSKDIGLQSANGEIQKSVEDISDEGVLTVDKRFFCNDCGKHFSRKDTLACHMQSHSGKKPFECVTCGLQYVRKNNLQRHELTHRDEKRYICEECGARFAVRYSLNLHKISHTSEKPFPCDICGIRLKTQASLKSHRLIHSGKKPHSCDTCGKKFAHKNVLNVHKLTHIGEKRFKCNTCGIAFRHKLGLDTHKFTHTGEKPFTCEECGMGFIRKFYLKSHKLKHTGEKPFPCNECKDKKFGTRSLLNQHKRVVHKWCPATKAKPNILR